MASNSFPLTTTRPQQQRTGLNRRNPRLTVLAKRASFQLGRPKNDDSEANQTDDSSNSKSFQLDFGKLPDVKSLIPVVANPSSGLAFGRRKDPGTVFVAGATGQVGIRIAQSLLQKGFSVRAGVPDLGAAQDLARLAATYKVISKEQAKRLNAVQSSFQDAESIAKAIGNAAKVVVTVGPAENGPDAQVTASDALVVVQAAELAGVSHVVIVYDSNVNVSTYNVLDGITSFFSNLFAQSQPFGVSEFLDKVIQTDFAYTFIKTNLTEDFSPEGPYNVVVSDEKSGGSGSSSDAYKVAMMKIASLVADVFTNTAVAENKVVEVFTDPSAPLRSVDELFSAIPEDGRRKAYAEALVKAKAEEEARIAAEKAREAEEAARKPEKQVQKLSKQEDKPTSLAEEAKEKVDAAGITVEGLLSRAKDIGSGLSWEKFGSQVATAVQNNADKPKVQIATVRGQARARNLQPKKAVVKQPNANPNLVAGFALKPKQERSKKPTGKDEEPKKEVRKVLGGLFRQETIYVDDEY